MAGTLSNVQTSGQLSMSLGSTTGSSATTSNINNSFAITFDVGTATGQVNKVYDGEITIASSGSPSTIDLTAAVDPQGTSNNFSVVNAIIITGESTTAGEDITPFGGSNGLLATGTAKILAGTKPGSVVYNFGTTGLTVDSTHKIITLTSAAGTNVKCKVTVVGK